MVHMRLESVMGCLSSYHGCFPDMLLLLTCLVLGHGVRPWQAAQLDEGSESSVVHLS